MKSVIAPRQFTAASWLAGFRSEELALPACALERQFWAEILTPAATPAFIGTPRADFSSIQPLLAANSTLFNSCSSSSRSRVD